MISLLIEKQIIFIKDFSQTYNKKNYNYSLYFSKKPLKSEVKWIKEVRKLFKIRNVKRNNYAAVIIIETTDVLYAVSYGIAHFFLSKYCDFDFGIDIASRIISEYKVKNSREFGGVTQKSILTYNRASEIFFEGGEAVNYIRGVPFDKKKWGKNISCGHSLKLRKRDFDITVLPRIISQIERSLANDPIKIEIPRSIRIINEEEQKKLEKLLIKNIKNKEYMIAISTQQLSGVDLIFSDKYTYHLVINGLEYEIDEDFPLEEINKIVKKNKQMDYTKLLNTRVNVKEEDQFIYSKKLINFIDFVDSKNNYYLEDGNWFQFDKNYIKYLRNTVEKIKIDNENELKNFDEAKYNKWLKKYNKNPKQWYREKYLNSLLEKNFNYLNYDRDFYNYEKIAVEFADLIKGSTFYFVKIGKPQKLNYVVDQSLSALKVFQHTGLTIKNNNKKISLTKFTLWIFLERKTEIKKIIEINSLIFLMKLANWRKEILLAGLEPELKISYYYNPKR